MEHCDHCNTDITNVNWFFIKECDSAPDSRVCGSCNKIFMDQCKADIEYYTQLEEEEVYHQLQQDAEDDSITFYLNLVGGGYIPNDGVINPAIHNLLFDMALKCLTVQRM